MNTKIKLMSLVVIVVSFFMSCSSLAGPLLAGTAKVDITPEIGIPLAGYGNRINKPNTGAHDRVYSRAIVFESDGKRTAVVCADILILSIGLRDDVARRVSDLELDFVSISATHTHYSVGSYLDNKVAEISVMGKYDPEVYKFLVSRIEQSIRDAAADMKPVKAGSAKGPAPEVTSNRRHKGGPTDPYIRVLALKSYDDEIIAVIMNHAIHPTTMPSKTVQVTGDVTGAAELWIEEKHDGAIAMFMNAGLGDQSPYPEKRKDKWDAMEEIGAKMAATADGLLTDMTFTKDAELTLYKTTFEMPEIYLRKSFQCFGGLNQLFKVFGKSMLRTQGELLGIGLGDNLLLFSPAEITLEVQTNIENMFPHNNVMVITHSNDLYGYVLTPEDFETGGYETCMSFYGKNFSLLLEEEFKKMVGKE
jgi:Neutral/alkaline non-lysosomal ceramidase, N-terminal